jgi:DNA-binding SARP family transcriptional activator
MLTSRSERDQATAQVDNASVGKQLAPRVSRTVALGPHPLDLPAVVDPQSVERPGLAGVVEFAVQLRAATQARHSRDAEAERTALAHGVAAYRGELLPEDGPAEWVIDSRERLQQQAATAAGRLAELALAGGDSRSAIDAARRSVEIDPFRDASWRILIAACDQAGEPAAARARQDYAEVLSTLDIPPPPSSALLASTPVR